MHLNEEDTMVHMNKCIRGFMTMCYINLRFTYLCTRLLLPVLLL